MNTNKKQLLKIIIFSFVGLITIIFAIWFINKYIYRGRAGTDKTGTVYFDQTSVNAAFGETFTFSVLVKPGNFRASGVKVPIYYNPYRLDLVSETVDENCADLGTRAHLNTRFKYYGQIISSVVAKKTNVGLKTAGQELCAVKLTFVPIITKGTAIISIPNLQAQAVSPDADVLIPLTTNSSSTLTVNIGSSTSTTPTTSPTSTMSGNAKFTFSVKMQGIGTESGVNNSVSSSTIPVKVKVVAVDGTLIGESSVNVNYNSSTGKWTSDELSVAAGNYRLIIKGPKHVARRFCENNPTLANETDSYSCGSKTISFVDGSNTYDFSGLLLLSGDLPLPQDGVLNAYDVAKMAECVGSETDGCIAAADLNYDSVVDGQDNSLMYASMKLKYDDEE